MAKKKIEEREPVYYKVYTDEELATFNLSLEKYRIHKTLSTGEKISYIKWENWLLSEGAYAQGKRGYEGQYHINDVEKYRELRDKLDQWDQWRTRRDFGKKQREVGSEVVVEKMTIQGGVDN